MQQLAATGDYLFYGVIALVIILIIAAIIAAIAISKRKNSATPGSHANHGSAPTQHAEASSPKHGNHTRVDDSDDSLK